MGSHATYFKQKARTDTVIATFYFLCKYNFKGSRLGIFIAMKIHVHDILGYDIVVMW
jgi:hypothetical protein